jgi:hypothetical protein
MKTNNQELNELFETLRIDTGHAGQIADDIRDGDEILRQQNHPEIPPALLHKIELTIAQKLSPKKSYIIRLKPLWAAAAIVMILFTITAIWTLNNDSASIRSQTDSTLQADILADEAILWDVALSQEYEASQVDDIVLGEVLSLWQDDLSNENSILRTEVRYEKHT